MLYDKKYLLDAVSEEDINDIVDDINDLYTDYLKEHQTGGTYIHTPDWRGASAYGTLEGGEPDTVTPAYYATLVNNHYNIESVSATALGRYRFTYRRALFNANHVIIPEYYGTSKYRTGVYARATTYCEVTLLDTSDNAVNLPSGEFLSVQVWGQIA